MDEPIRVLVFRQPRSPGVKLENVHLNRAKKIGAAADI